MRTLPAPLRPLVTVAVATALVLMIPLVAMLFTAEVDWGAEDFVAAGALLFGTGLVAGAVARTRNLPGRYRLLGLVAVAALFLLTWAELAVGVFGTPVAGS
ncbi:MAG: hypothetical protein Kow0010_16220 [Dehalococcoidia bacterium]